MIFQGQSLKTGLSPCGSTGAVSKTAPFQIPLRNGRVKYIKEDKPGLSCR